MKTPTTARFACHPLSRVRKIVTIHTWTMAVVFCLLVLLPGNLQRVQAVSSALLQPGGLRQLILTPLAPVAAFESSARSGEAPWVVQFYDRSTGAPTSWWWDFGDGATALDANPIHRYDNPGGYDVTLTVSNSAGTHTVTRRTYIIVNSAPVIEPVAPPDLPSLFEDAANLTTPAKEADPAVRAAIVQAANSPNPPVLQSPANGATAVSSPSTTLEACVADPDGDNLTVTFYGRDISPMNVPDFTIVAIPDTQFYYYYDNAAGFLAQIQWILNNRTSRNIVFVSHLGDVVEEGSVPDPNSNAEAQWQRADVIMRNIEDQTLTTLLDGIPYGIAVGNHDQGPSYGDPSKTQLFNQYFGVSRFAGRQYYGGHLGADNDNSYQLFSVGDLKFITIHLEFDTSNRPNTFAWVNNLLQTHADRLAILSAHEILHHDANWRSQGEKIWNGVKDNPNLFLMLAGHIGGEARRQDRGYHGNLINTLLSDYQNRANGGDGWFRYLEFSGDSSEVTVYTYSATKQQYEQDANSFFKVSWDSPTTGPLRRPFQIISKVANVASGACVTATWSTLASNRQYEWYVGVDDTPSDTSDAQTFSSRAIFSTGNGPLPSSTPTQTATATPVNTTTSTATSTASSTATATAMATPTPSQTATATPVNTATGTATSTASSTATATATATPTPSQTLTPTPTVQPTATATGTQTPTATATATTTTTTQTTMGFSSDTYTVDAASTAAVITVTLSESVNVSVTVHYTATYTPQAAAQSIGSNQISGNLIFAPGELTQSFSLTLLPEWKANLPARITLELDSVNSEIVSGQNSATLTIMQRFFLPLIQQN